MNSFIECLQLKQDLSFEQCLDLFSQLPKCSLEQQAAVLLAWTQKELTLDEIGGAKEALALHATPISYDQEVVDIVGTGGDGLGSFNVSTAASLVLASCGVPVAKHGGRAVSSKAGSMDVIAALGIAKAETAQDCSLSLTTKGYAYLWAPLFNQALQSLAPVRRHLGIPTILNIVAPLLNPLRPQRQVLGVYQASLVPIMAQILQQSGLKQAMVVHSLDGLDEFSLSAPCQVAWLRQGKITTDCLSASDIGLSSAPLAAITGGDALFNASLIEGILTGQVRGAPLDVVLFNCAAGLLVAGKVSSWQEGIARAALAIRSGEAAKFLQSLQIRPFERSPVFASVVPSFLLREAIQEYIYVDSFLDCFAKQQRRGGLAYTNHKEKIMTFIETMKQSVRARAASIAECRGLAPNTMSFLSAFNKQTECSIIAEIKFASPSRGKIYPGTMDPVAIAGDYLTHGAQALSILTEPEYFQGNIESIGAVRKAYPKVPILLKDFVLYPQQISQALHYGANAVLLIVAFLSPTELQTLYNYALSLSLTPLIEVHTEAELHRALELAPDLIGINHRNLNDLTIDLEVSASLMQAIPEGITVIAESGIASQDSLKKMKQLGFDGCLIGSHCMQDPYPGRALQKLLRREDEN